MQKCILMLGIQDSLFDSLSTLMGHFGYRVLPAFNIGMAGWLVTQRKFTLIVVNVGYFQTGLSELLAKVREYQQAPIAALSDEMLLGNAESNFDVDYTLSAQLHPRKMIAYFIALMKRYRGDIDFIKPKPLDGWPIEQGDFFVDQLLDWASVGERSIELSPKESQLLVYFLLRPKQTLSCRTVCATLWMEMGGYGCDERPIIEELRSKIEPDPSHPVYLKDVPHGYRFYDTANYFSKSGTVGPKL